MMQIIKTHRVRPSLKNCILSQYLLPKEKMQVQILNSLAFLMNSFKISNISNHYKYDYVICQEEQI